MKIAIIDNYDSFTYNLRQLLVEAGADADVLLNDSFSMDTLEQYDKIVFSPGPGLPSDAGLMEEVISQYAGRKPMLGICLGEQAIGEVFGARLKNIQRVFHGEQTVAAITATDYIFHGLGDMFPVGRYHSWVVDSEELPHCLEVTSMSSEGYIMSIRHKEYDIHGVQFHPESILTPGGATIISNFVNHPSHDIL